MRPAALAAALGAIVSVGLTAQQPKFRASGALVRLEVRVADDRGAIRGLRTGDFVVEDRGAPQVVRVEEVADAPLDIVLVAQTIESVMLISAEQAPRITAGLTAFLRHVQDRDRLAALLASSPPVRLRQLESGAVSLTADAFRGSSDAAPFDAIAAALREFGDSDRVRALVAFTNGSDFRSTTSFDAILALARRPGPAFVLIGTPVRISEVIRFRAAVGGAEIPNVGTEGVVSGSVFPKRLEQLAGRTGGVALNLADGDPDTIMSELFTRLRTRYLISYVPPAGEGWHPVRVEVKRRGARVTVRDGYFVD